MPHYSSRTRNTKNIHNKTQLKTQVNTSDTALHIALKNNNYKIAMELIEHGADVNIKNHDGYTAIDIVLRQSSKEAINIAVKLIEHGADINTKNHNGDTALHLALKHYNDNMTITLIEQGANANIKNNQGETPLHIVAQHRDQYADNIAIKLIEHGADANIKNNKGETPLHIVAQRHDIYAPNMAVTLMEHGSDVNIKNNISKIQETPEPEETISANNHATQHEELIIIITEQNDIALGGDNTNINTIFD